MNHSDFTQALTNARAHVRATEGLGVTPDPYAEALVELANSVTYLLDATHYSVENLCRRVLRKMVLP